MDLVTGGRVSLDRLRAALGAIPPEELITLFMVVRQTQMPLALASWLEMALVAEMDVQAGKRAAVPNPIRVIDAADIPKSVVVLAALAIKLKQNGHERSSEFVEAAGECLKPPPLMH